MRACLRKRIAVPDTSLSRDGIDSRHPEMHPLNRMDVTVMLRSKAGLQRRPSATRLRRYHIPMLLAQQRHRPHLTSHVIRPVEGEGKSTCATSAKSDRAVVEHIIGSYTERSPLFVPAEERGGTRRAPPLRVAD
jgi:hypothetical protein